MTTIPSTILESLTGDQLIMLRDALDDRLRFTEFPRLMPVQVDDGEGETFPALRCPRCDDLVNSGDLYAVSPAEHWVAADDIESDETHESRTVWFSNDQIPELDETLYYRHGMHAVSLPEGWDEEWR